MLCVVISATVDESAVPHGQDPFTFTTTISFNCNPTLVMSFTNSSRYIRGRNTLNHVHGNQVNGTINAGIVNFTAGQETTQRTGCDEFQYVKREDMFIIKEIYSVDLSGWDWNWRNGQLIGRHKSARRSIYVVEILPYRQAKFTAVMYEGDDVQNAWEADFRQFSCPRLVL